MRRGEGWKGGPAWARHMEESGEGSGTGMAHNEGGARWSRNPGAAGRRRAGSPGDAGAQQGREMPIGGPARRVGPSCREREEGREGDRWARFSNLSQIQRFKLFELDST
jgi:hypothetical protein